MAYPTFSCLRTILLLNTVLLLPFLATSCGRFESRFSETGVPTATISSPSKSGAAPPPPIPGAEAEEWLDVGAILGATVMDGRPYLTDVMATEILYHEPWVNYQTVHQLKLVYTLTQDLVEQELGVADIAPVATYLVLEEQFNRFAESYEFQHPSYLVGFYSYVVRDGQVVDAEIFLNARAQGFVTNVAHEMAHLATAGLPTWISEGVADYIGYRAGMALEPESTEHLMPKARQTVRAALSRNLMLGWDELEELNWMTTNDVETLDMVYAESWQLMEYIASEYAPYGLRNLVAGYVNDAQKGGDPFPLAIGLSAEALWQEFSIDIMENWTPEERVGLSICDLTQAVKESENVTREWDQFLVRASREQVRLSTEQLLRFGKQWDALARDVGELTATGEASVVRDLWLAYFQTMAQAMEDLSAGDIVNANQQISDAKHQYTRATSVLQEALLSRPVLVC